MSYENLRGGVDIVIAHAEEANRNIKKLVKFMNDKAALDLQYGRHLHKLASKVQLEGSTTNLGNANSLVYFFSQFQSLISALAQDHEILSNKVIEQIGQVFFSKTL